MGGKHSKNVELDLDVIVLSQAFYFGNAPNQGFYPT
jgi:hypothetical protein